MIHILHPEQPYSSWGMQLAMMPSPWEDGASGWNPIGKNNRLQNFLFPLSKVQCTARES